MCPIQDPQKLIEVTLTKEEESDNPVEITARLWVSFNPGTKPWRGLIHRCPSDIDYYGEDPYVTDWEIGDLIITTNEGSLECHDKQELRYIRSWVEENIRLEELDKVLNLEIAEV